MNLLTVFISAVALSMGSALAQSKTSIEKLTSKKRSRSLLGEGDSNPVAITDSYRRKCDCGPTGDGLKVHSLGLGLGQTFVQGDFSSNGRDKITYDFFYNYSASHSFDLSINYHSSLHKRRGGFSRLRGLAVGIKGKLYQFDSFSPFVLGGLGFYAPKIGKQVSGTMVESSSRAVFGFNAGVGGELNLNRKTSVGILALYHNPFDRSEDVMSDIEGSYFKLLITTYYRL